VVFPLAAAFVLPIFALTISRRYKTFVGVSALVICLLALVQLVLGQREFYAMGGWNPPVGIALNPDAAGSLMACYLGIVLVLTVFHSMSGLPKGRSRRYYYTLVLVMWGGLNGIVLTADLFNLTVFIEVTAVTASALVAYAGTDRALEMTLKYILTGAIGSILIILATAIIWFHEGSLVIQPTELPRQAALAALVLYIAGFTAKIALVPAHWLADAHGSAPAPVAVLLSAGLMKAQIFALFRIVYGFFGWGLVAALGVDKLLMALAILSALAGSLLALGQRDLFRMLAFSSITQLSFALMALGAGPEGIAPGLWHLLNHGLMKGALFLAAGRMAQTGGETALTSLAGAGGTSPLAMAAFAGGSLAIVGIPVFNGFFSKWLIGKTLAETGNWAGLATMALTTSFSAAYFLRAAHWLLKPHGNTIDQGEYQGSIVPALVFALLCLVTGLLPSLPLTLARQAAQVFGGGGP
jgi:formate hydrogenlyase subunit 3/multisubunit Na+/H+ antiporter MnhD subunit